MMWRLATFVLLSTSLSNVSGMLFRQLDANLASSVVRKPLTDNRKYEYVTFQNGLKVLAVQDPRAAKAGFAVAVEAGSFYDPTDFPGLAHFCEHLLFLGTKKYPDETSFDNFMSLHDGSNNAFTEQEKTVFYNEVGHAGFEEGMDRFAQFFIAPLFKQEMVGRELNAVNSEHQKNIPDQGRRLWEIMRGTARNDSVISRFYTGTVDSLHHGDNKTVAALRKYHDANYCAPRMNLVMISNLSTADQLAAAHRHFDEVPRGQCGPAKDFNPKVTGVPAFGSEHVGQFIRMGTESTPTLWMMFPLDPTAANYSAAPVQYLSYVLGYAGPSSLKSQLMKRGLVTDLGFQADENSASTLLFMMFGLSPKGAEEAGVKEIVDTTFSFLNLLHKETKQEVPAVYESLQQMSKISFDYSEAPDSVMDGVSALATAMSQYPAADVLTAANGVVDKPDPALVRSILKQMAAPRSSNVALATKAFKASEANKYEKYYDIHFHQGPMPDTWGNRKTLDALATGMAADHALAPPPPLHYVPSAMQLRNATAGPHPVLVKVEDPSTAGAALPVDLWWKGQGTFVLPKAQLRLKLGVAAAEAKGGSQDATMEATMRLHVALAKQVLEEATEDLQNCGVTFQLEAGGDGYGISADGYDQHMDTLVLQVLEGLLRPQFGADDFAHAQRAVTDELSDTTRKAPYELAMEELGALTTEHAASREEVLAAVSAVDEAKLREHVRRLPLDGLRVQLLAVGNMGKEKAQELAASVAKKVRGEAAGKLLLPSQARRSRVWVASRPVELRMRNPIPGDTNSATVSSYQFGVPTVAERVRLILLGKMIANPVYDTLRTKKQLGYIVFGFISEQGPVVELRVLVQGNKELPDRVEGDISAVIQDFGAGLKNLSSSEFAKWKASVRSSLQHKDQNMAQEADRYWGQIANDGLCFNRKELAQQYLEELKSPADVIETFAQLQHRHQKVSVKMFGAGADQAAVVAAPASIAQTGSATVVHLAGASTKDKQALLKQSGEYYGTETICRIK